MSFLCFVLGHKLEKKQRVQEIEDIGFIRIDFLKCGRCSHNELLNVTVNPILHLGKETNMISYAREYFDVMSRELQ